MPTCMVKATNIGPNGTKGFKLEKSSQKSCDQIYPVRVTEKSVESILCGIRRHIMSHLDIRKQICSTRTEAPFRKFMKTGRRWTEEPLVRRWRPKNENMFTLSHLTGSFHILLHLILILNLLGIWMHILNERKHKFSGYKTLECSSTSYGKRDHSWGVFKCQDEHKEAVILHLFYDDSVLLLALKVVNIWCFSLIKFTHVKWWLKYNV